MRENTRNFEEFCIQNEGFCIQNEELCIKNDEFCIQNEEICIKNDEFCINIDGILQDGAPADVGLIRAVLQIYISRSMILHRK